MFRAQIVTSEVLKEIPSLFHGFGTKVQPLPFGLELSPEISKQRWEQSRPKWRQVHGIETCKVTEHSHDCGDVDGIYTNANKTPIAVVSADCVPILFARTHGPLKVAAVHSGWRGTEGRIVEKLWDRLKLEGERPEEWVAAIGPAIGPCCYEVSEELAQSFKENFGDLGAQVAVPEFRKLDLPRIAFELLTRIGLEEVDLIRACTKCARDPLTGEFLYHSFRREGGGTRQWSLIEIQN